jgi:hypothetical protein
MHLLFLGIVQTLTDMVESWLAIKAQKFLPEVYQRSLRQASLSLQYPTTKVWNVGSFSWFVG